MRGARGLRFRRCPPGRAYGDLSSSDPEPASDSDSASGCASSPGSGAPGAACMCLFFLDEREKSEE
jgi:hypothetical protein